MTETDTTENRRYRGVLTRADREFLRGDTDPSTEASRDARYRIRERVKSAVLDMELLFERLSNADREQVSTDLYAEHAGTIVSTLALLYLSTHDRAGTPEPTDSDNSCELFERLVETAILTGERKRGYLSMVDVRIAIESTQPDPEDVRNRIRNGDGTDADFFYLGYVDRYHLLKETVESGESFQLQDTVHDDTLEITPDRAEELLHDEWDRW